MTAQAAIFDRTVDVGSAVVLLTLVLIPDQEGRP